MKSFKKHTMYNKAGEGFTANTHSKPSSTEKKVGRIIKKKSGY